LPTANALTHQWSAGAADSDEFEKDMGSGGVNESHLVHGLQVASNLLLKGCACSHPLLPSSRTSPLTGRTGGWGRAPKGSGTKIPYRRVLLFTNNDQPVQPDGDGSSALQHRVQILREQGHDVELMGLVRLPLLSSPRTRGAAQLALTLCSMPSPGQDTEDGGKFDLSKCYQSVVPDVSDSAMTASLEGMEAAFKQRMTAKRKLRSLWLDLEVVDRKDDTTPKARIGVGLYTLVAAATKGAKTSLRADGHDEPEETVTTTSWTCSVRALLPRPPVLSLAREAHHAAHPLAVQDTGDTVASPLHCAQLGAADKDRLDISGDRGRLMDRETLQSVKRLLNVGLQLLGFKPVSEVMATHPVAGSREREGTRWTHTGGGKALAFKPTPNATRWCHNNL
jgi:hypothetical protein